MDNATKGIVEENVRAKLFKVTSFGTTKQHGSKDSYKRVPVDINLKTEMSAKNTDQAGGTADEDEGVFTISCKLPT